MLNGKYVSCAEIIREVYRDNKYSYELPWQDAIEWSVDAIELIGAPMALQPKQVCIAIENYRGMLPCDLSQITQVAGSFSGCWPFPMRSNTNTFHAVFTCDTNQILPELIQEAGISSAITDPIGVDISGNPVYATDAGNWALPETITDPRNNSIAFDPTYTVNDNFIFTNFQTGFVFIAYKALPVDKDGFPLIPDNRRYKEAVKSFIRYKIDYILWRTDELTKDVYQDSEKEWLWYVGSAGNAARIPNVDGMYSLMNQMKLIPQKYAHNNFFRTLGS